MLWAVSFAFADALHRFSRVCLPIVETDIGLVFELKV